MSTLPRHDGCDDASHPDPLTDPTLCSETAQWEYIVTVLEPRARVLNREFTDAFGPHPSSPQGSWVYIEQREDGSFWLALEAIKVDHAFRLAPRFDLIGELLDDDAAEEARPSRRPDDPGMSIVGDAARLSSIPPVHVRIQRQR